MPQSTADRIVGLLRPEAPEQKFVQEEVDLINALATKWDLRRAALSSTAATPAVPTSSTPTSTPWIDKGRSRLGQREIVGPQNNNWIAKGWAVLGASWFNNDETPWCGFFVGWSLHEAGLPIPGGGEFARAKRWATWGTEVSPRFGAIGVKSRSGGGHVFFIVGETPDGQYYKALGGNQGNQVSITDIRKSDVIAVRWPQGAPVVNIPLPKMARGTTNVSEA